MGSRQRVEYWRATGSSPTESLSGERGRGAWSRKPLLLPPRAREAYLNSDFRDLSADDRAVLRLRCARLSKLHFSLVVCHND
jgi:hypothetical protein